MVEVLQESFRIRNIHLQEHERKRAGRQKTEG